jgi:FkbM family methyltransferase
MELPPANPNISTRFLRSAGLSVINVSRKLFYNTWIHRLPLTNVIYQRLFSALYTDTPETTVSCGGFHFHVSTRDITIVPSLLNGDYETAELAFFRALLKPGMCVLDLGANIGLYAVPAGAAVAPGGRVYAFEPEPNNLSYLRRNLAENAIENVEVLPVCVGDRPGAITLYLAEGGIGTHSIGKVGAQSIEVDVVCIDDVLRDVVPDVIKIDIEGYEPAALRGMSRILTAARPTVLIEFNAEALKRCGFSPTEFFDSLTAQFPFVYVFRGSELKSLDAAGRALVRDSTYANLLLSHRSLDFMANDTAVS